MSKSYRSLGLMSGTSADGVDASIIQSDGDTKYEVILDKYFKYSQNIYPKLLYIECHHLIELLMHQHHLLMCRSLGPNCSNIYS